MCQEEFNVPIILYLTRQWPRYQQLI